MVDKIYFLKVQSAGARGAEFELEECKEKQKRFDIELF
ncbi:hypothetical protein M23134_05048 [Microscilla marina ATCC 23134]|uniref:Uncharacterized protein n=1 Tax=Microscilla marina ATCC 23134 TaxID=313606 RepID=A1ZD03_MICM2|nr:hypothetical protein M23134_05048 [Microscilla marina ATCC 23134]